MVKNSTIMKERSNYIPIYNFTNHRQSYAGESFIFFVHNLI